MSAQVNTNSLHVYIIIVILVLSDHNVNHFVSIQMGYGSRALNLLGQYYEGHIPSLSEGQLHINPITSIDPDQVSKLL